MEALSIKEVINTYIVWLSYFGTLILNKTLTMKEIVYTLNRDCLGKFLLLVEVVCTEYTHLSIL